LGGSCNFKTSYPISTKLGISDHIAHPTPHAKFGYSRFKGGVAAHARNLLLGVYFFFLRTSTGSHVESTNAANGSNEAS